MWYFGGVHMYLNYLSCKIILAMRFTSDTYKHTYGARHMLLFKHYSFPPVVNNIFYTHPTVR